MVSIEYKLNDTVALTSTVGQQTALKTGKFKNGESKSETDGDKGTTVYVYPHVQVFASSTASITASAVITFDRINIAGNDVRTLVNVPLVVKLAL
ncbi:MAG: hypothetical protein K2N31_05565 [Treponemataceae bacterium]|nr:hypothetical protein [Treponemataceae bacterium]